MADRAGDLLRQVLEDWQRAGVTALPPGEPIDLPPGFGAASAPTTPSQTDAPMPRSNSGRKSGPTSEPNSGSSAAGSPKRPSPAAVATAASGDAATTLAVLADQVAGCTLCEELAATRTQTVFGAGSPTASILFLGEAPGADEDATGEPFVGRAGKLLNDIIAACGWKREELYICNVLRCRPPGNRNPTTQEAANCRGWLDGQIAAVKPDWIVCWGSVAAKELLQTKKAIGKLRRQLFDHAYEGGSAQVLCTYHPSYLLRNPPAKKDVWEDLKFLMAEMDGR